MQVVRYSVRAHSSHMHIHAHVQHVHVHAHVCHVVCCFLVFGYVHCGGLVFVWVLYLFWGFRWGILFSLDITCVCRSLYTL